MAGGDRNDFVHRDESNDEKEHNRCHQREAFRHWGHENSRTDTHRHSNWQENSGTVEENWASAHFVHSPPDGKRENDRKTIGYHPNDHSNRSYHPRKTHASHRGDCDCRWVDGYT